MTMVGAYGPDGGGGAGGGGGGGTPGAPTTSVQFNNSGAFAGDAGFTFDTVTKQAFILGGVLFDIGLGNTTTLTAEDDGFGDTALTITNSAGLAVLYLEDYGEILFSDDGGDISSYVDGGGAVLEQVKFFNGLSLKTFGPGRPILIKTGDSANDDINLTTGNAPAGDTGSIALTTGTAGGARGDATVTAGAISLAADADLTLTGLQTLIPNLVAQSSDPGVAGALYHTAGVVMVSL